MKRLMDLKCQTFRYLGVTAALVLATASAPASVDAQQKRQKRHTRQKGQEQQWGSRPVAVLLMGDLNSLSPSHRELHQR